MKPGDKIQRKILSFTANWLATTESFRVGSSSELTIASLYQGLVTVEEMPDEQFTLTDFEPI